MMIQTEIAKHIVNKDLLQKRFRCASKTYDKHAVVQKTMAGVLVDVALNHIPKKQNSMMELGCGTGLLTREITECFQAQDYTANDLVPEVEENIRQIIGQKQNISFQFQQGDAERIDMGNKKDVIWSGATIQWIEDLDAFFARMHASLNDQGYLAISSFDIDNFLEVKAITGIGIDYKPMHEVLMHAGKYFRVLESESWHQKLWFKQPREVLRHMRFTGVNAVSATKWGKADLENFNLDYESFKTEEGYPLTYHPFVLVLQK
ncbi:malonyl-ACP O-methyltransferase BioC [Labilibacter sediminis]|nr:malonyl-ACP O-methyltransferase BioC [Labilibacter sediminis]